MTSGDQLVASTLVIVDAEMPNLIKRWVGPTGSCEELDTFVSQLKVQDNEYRKEWRLGKNEDYAYAISRRYTVVKAGK